MKHIEPAALLEPDSDLCERPEVVNSQSGYLHAFETEHPALEKGVESNARVVR